MPVVKEVLSSFEGSKVDNVESQVCSSVSTSSHSFGAAKLGMSLSHPFPRMSKGGAPIYSSISKSQLGYSWRVKEKVAKQLHKNKELFTEVVAEIPVEGVEGYSKVVINAVNFAPLVGLS